MKKLLVSLILLLHILSFSSAQISTTWGPLLFADTLSFKPLDSLFLINYSDSNAWQISNHLKGQADSTLRGRGAIMTDSTNMYGNNLNCSFYLTVPGGIYTWWGSTMISFYHKYVTDTLTDGGIIEISFDNGNAWEDVNKDIYHITNFIGLPADTIKGGHYGYSGNSGGWRYVELYWIWFMLSKGESMDTTYSPILRFRFQSDSVNTQKEGWMISNFVLRGYAPSGSVSKMKNEQVLVFPNPANDIVHLVYKENSKKNIKIEVFDELGRLELAKTSDISYLDITTFARGVYILKISELNKLIYCGKLVKN